MTEDYYRVGKIVNTQGLKGDVRVQSSTDFPDQRFRKGSQLTVLGSNDQFLAELIVDGHYKHKSFDILHFEGHDRIEDVESYKGCHLYVSADHRQEELAEGEYYYNQIIGLEVFSLEGDYLGQIKEITALGPNDVWTISRPQGKEALIPYIEDVVKDINLDKGQVRIDVLPGLLE